MNILIVGAGAIGGYFGARLLETGKDVSFLVRPKRKEQLEQTGLHIVSINGDSHQTPRLVTTTDSGEKFDLIMLSTKSYHLTQTIEDIRPFVKEETIILPLLNGIAHMQQLIDAFGEEAVIGGLCFIETTLDEQGTIHQKSPSHQLMYGERSGVITTRMSRLKQLFDGANAAFELSEDITQAMWNKYLFITTISGITSLMDSPIGPIMELESGRSTVNSLLGEIAASMKKIGVQINEQIVDDQFNKIKNLPYEMKSSMQRDIEKLFPLEADHLQGFLLDIARSYDVPAPILETIYTKLKIYENQR